MVGSAKKRLGRKKINNSTFLEKEELPLKILNGNYLVFDFDRLKFVYKSFLNDLENDDNN